MQNILQWIIGTIRQSRNLYLIHPITPINPLFNLVFNSMNLATVALQITDHTLVLTYTLCMKMYVKDRYEKGQGCIWQYCLFPLLYLFPVSSLTSSKMVLIVTRVQCTVIGKTIRAVVSHHLWEIYFVCPVIYQNKADTIIRVKLVSFQLLIFTIADHSKPKLLATEKFLWLKFCNPHAANFIIFPKIFVSFLVIANKANLFLFCLCLVKLILRDDLWQKDKNKFVIPIFI